MNTSSLTSVLVWTVAIAVLASPAEAQDPYLSPDDTWITIDGTVAEVMPDQFLLDYGEGQITVEFDDEDRDAEAYELAQGDSVSISGLIDDDFLEVATIEARSIYVQKLGTRFFTTPLDEEDRRSPPVPPVDIPEATLTGTVSAVGEDDFLLNTGPRAITVEVGNMAYDPLDEEGYQRIQVGDRVRITGEIDANLFQEDRRLVAETITKLSR